MLPITARRSQGFPFTKPPASPKGLVCGGGTSAGAPQWAAIKALGLSADNQQILCR